MSEAWETVQSTLEIGLEVHPMVVPVPVAFMVRQDGKLLGYLNVADVRRAVAQFDTAVENLQKSRT